MIPELAAALERRERVVLATVVRARQSVPRRPGSKMLIYADGRTSGTIGGGEMEHRVVAAAPEVLAEGRPRLVTYSLIDPARGDPGVCGGEVDVYLEPYMPSPTLLVVGAGHVGRAVSELAHWLGFRTVVWDDRDGIVDESSDHVDIALTGPLPDALADHPLTPDDAIVVVTRNVALDLEVLPALLDAPVGYIGVMGSRRRWSTTRAGLVERGVDEQRLDRVHSPIGVEISAETPEEIAVSILAEVVGARRGG